MNWESIIKRISYKPNVKIEIQGNRFLMLTYCAPDAFTDAGEVSIVHQSSLPEYVRGEHEAIAFIFHCISAAEHHEMYDWLRFDGQLVQNMHSKEEIQNHIRRFILDQSIHRTDSDSDNFLRRSDAGNTRIRNDDQLGSVF